MDSSIDLREGSIIRYTEEGGVNVFVLVEN
jgi:hypothetical protein